MKEKIKLRLLKDKNKYIMLFVMFLVFIAIAVNVSVFAEEIDMVNIVSYTDRNVLYRDNPNHSNYNTKHSISYDGEKSFFYRSEDGITLYVFDGGRVHSKSLLNGNYVNSVYEDKALYSDISYGSSSLPDGEGVVYTYKYPDVGDYVDNVYDITVNSIVFNRPVFASSQDMFNYVDGLGDYVVESSGLDYYIDSNGRLQENPILPNELYDASLGVLQNLVIESRRLGSSQSNVYDIEWTPKVGAFGITYRIEGRATIQSNVDDVTYNHKIYIPLATDLEDYVGDAYAETGQTMKYIQPIEELSPYFEHKLVGGDNSRITQLAFRIYYYNPDGQKVYGNWLTYNMSTGAIVDLGSDSGNMGGGTIAEEDDDGNIVDGSVVEVDQDGNVVTDLDTSNIIDKIKNGFGLLGNSGVIMLFTGLFSWIPNEVWALVMTGLGLAIVVTLFKIARG